MAAAVSSWEDMIEAAAAQHTVEWAAVEAMTAPWTILDTLSRCTGPDCFLKHGYVPADDQPWPNYTTYTDTQGGDPSRPKEIQIWGIQGHMQVHIFDDFDMEVNHRNIWSRRRAKNSSRGLPTYVNCFGYHYLNEKGDFHNLFGASLYCNDSSSSLVLLYINGNIYDPEDYDRAVARILDKHPDLVFTAGTRTKAARA